MKLQPALPENRDTPNFYSSASERDILSLGWIQVYED